MDEIDVHRWETECWNCGEDTPVVWPYECSLDSELGERLTERPEYNVWRVFSKSLGRKV